MVAGDAPLPPMPPPPRGGQGTSLRNRRFLGVLSWVTFFAQAKKVIKKIFPQPRCGWPAVGKLWNLCLPKPLPPTSRAAKRSPHPPPSVVPLPRWGRLTSRRTRAAALAKGDARPPPYRQRPARFDHEASRAPLPSFAVSIGSRREACRKLLWHKGEARRGCGDNAQNAIAFFIQMVYNKVGS